MQADKSNMVGSGGMSARLIPVSLADLLLAAWLPAAAQRERAETKHFDYETFPTWRGTFGRLHLIRCVIRPAWILFSSHSGATL